MTYYIKPHQEGKYSSPQTLYTHNALMLPESLLPKYLEYKGYIIPTVENNIITDIQPNEEALAAYEERLAAAAEATQPTKPTITPEERIAALETALAQTDETLIELYEMIGGTNL